MQRRKRAVWATGAASADRGCDRLPSGFRRLVRDYESLPATHEAMIWTAATWQLSDRLSR